MPLASTIEKPLIGDPSGRARGDIWVVFALQRQADRDWVVDVEALRLARPHFRDGAVGETYLDRDLLELCPP